MIVQLSTGPPQRGVDQDVTELGEVVMYSGQIFQMAVGACADQQGAGAAWIGQGRHYLGRLPGALPRRDG